MAVLSSDQLKAIVVPLNICDDGNKVYRDNIATLQSYNYGCFRTRGHLSLPYGNVHSSILDLNLRNFPDFLEKYFLKSLQSPEPYEISLIFNAVFDANGELREYDDAFVARGYTVDIQETYSTDITNESQRLINIKMLLSKIIYIGDNSKTEMIISND